MSRSTQFIGLNNKAREYVKDLVYIPHCGGLTSGMFDEEIPLGGWQHPERGIIKEVVQEVPWSSGPMIFTRLSWDIGNQIEIIDGKEVNVPMDIPMFEWTHNPSVRDMEFDAATGELWI